MLRNILKAKIRSKFQTKKLGALDMLVELPDPVIYGYDRACLAVTRDAARAIVWRLGQPYSNVSLDVI